MKHTAALLVVAVFASSVAVAQQTGQRQPQTPEPSPTEPMEPENANDDQTMVPEDANADTTPGEDATDDAAGTQRRSGIGSRAGGAGNAGTATNADNAPDVSAGPAPYGRPSPSETGNAVSTPGASTGAAPGTGSSAGTGTNAGSNAGAAADAATNGEAGTVRQAAATATPAAPATPLPVRMLIVPDRMAAGGSETAMRTGCWARIYSGPGLTGDSVTIVGPIDLPRLSGPFDLAWADRIGSIEAGPGATLSLFGDERYEDLQSQLPPARRLTTLNDELESLRIACGRAAAGGTG